MVEPKTDKHRAEKEADLLPSLRVRAIDQSSPKELELVVSWAIAAVLESIPEFEGDEAKARGALPNFDREQMTQMIAGDFSDPEKRIMVAVLDGELVGQFLYSIKRDEQGVTYGFCYTLYVAKAHRQCGVALALMAMAMVWFREQAATYVLAQTHTTNLAAKRAMEKLRFEEVGRRKGAWESFQMKKPLGHLFPFEDHKSNRLVHSHWVPFGPHEITAAGAPGVARVSQWVEAGVTDVVTLLREDEMRPGMKGWFEEAGFRWWPMPLSGKKLSQEGDQETLRRLRRWAQELLQESRGQRRRVVVHCAAGMHRTGVALLVMFSRAHQGNLWCALDDVSAARQLTAQEVLKRPRRGERLLDLVWGLERGENHFTGVK